MLFKKQVLAAAMSVGLFALSGGAYAQIAVGGGATLPEVLYDQILPSGVGNTTFSYTGTGSGAGKSGFLSNSATAFKNESTGGTTAWGTTQSVHFAGSDSALSSTELTNYNNADAARVGTAKWGKLVQVPAVATAVVLPWKQTTGVTNLNLTTQQVCRIFAYHPLARNWSQVVTGAPATPIQVVYRSETSGTTELLSNFLKAACAAHGLNFTVSNNFATVVSTAMPAGTTPATANWVAATGSSGVKTALQINGRFSYLSPDSAYVGTDNSKVAAVNGSLPDSAAIRTALAGWTFPNGADSDPLAWVPAYQVPASGYPIIGTTNLLVNQCYKQATVQANVKGFLTALNNGTHDAAISNHLFVKLPDTWLTKINSTFLTATNTLAIGNTNVCNGIGRPAANPA